MGSSACARLRARERVFDTCRVHYTRVGRVQGGSQRRGGVGRHCPIGYTASAPACCLLPCSFFSHGGARARSGLALPFALNPPLHFWTPGQPIVTGAPVAGKRIIKRGMPVSPLVEHMDAILAEVARAESNLDLRISG